MAYVHAAGVSVVGRGTARRPVVTAIHVPDDGSGVCIRIDDAELPEFWLELHVTAGEVVSWADAIASRSRDRAGSNESSASQTA